MNRFEQAKARVIMELGIGVLEVADSSDFAYYKTIVEALEIAQRYEAAAHIVNKINAIRGTENEN